VSAIALRGITKRFADVEALRGVDLDIAAGGLTAILGPSGCGKTTLLRLIAGFLDPDAGTITFDGKPIVGPTGSVPARHRRVGYVPQEGALFPHLSVASNITFGLDRATKRSGGRLVELLDLVGLDAKIAKRYPHELSGGQQQRAALARALAPSPEVILLDEPFSSLDAGLREETGQAVAQVLRTSGTTTVLVTHDQSEALSLADRVAVMRDGELIQISSPQDLYRHPSDPGVASFVGGAVLLPGVMSGSHVSCPLGLLAVDGADAPDGDDASRPVQVLVRPELIAIAPYPGAGIGATSVAAKVVDVTYFGGDATVRLVLTNTGSLVTARVLGTDLPSPGDHVALSVRGPVPVFAAPSD
jgi:iron(III) transport system ATP-binding protein